MTKREKAGGFEEWAAKGSRPSMCEICNGFSEDSLDMIREFLRLKVEGKCRRSYGDLADLLREKNGDDTDQHGIGRHVRRCESELYKAARGR